jgi:hypothetical protein
LSAITNLIPAIVADRTYRAQVVGIPFDAIFITNFGQFLQGQVPSARRTAGLRSLFATNTVLYLGVSFTDA